MLDAFEVYGRDFAAQRHALVRNYRSAPELIRIQQVIAQSIESGTPPVEADAPTKLPERVLLRKSKPRSRKLNISPA